MSRITSRLGWGVAGALAIALLASIASVIYAGTQDPPAGVTTSTSTQTGLIFQPTNCAAFPITIGTFGSYKLAQDIIMPASCGKNGINITAPDVTLDLDGHQVGGVGGSLIGINVTGPTGVVIENGRVVNWGGNGITLTAETVARDLIVRGNGGFGLRASGARAQIMNVTAQGNAGGGIRVDGDSSTVSKVIASNNGDDGILVGGRVTVTDCVSTVNGGSAGGIYVNGSGDIVSGCEFASNTNTGIYVNGSLALIENNNVHNNGASGIVLLGGRSRIVGNNVEQNVGSGIWVVSGTTTVSDNTSTGNTANGYYIQGGGSRVDNNHSVDNLVGFLVDDASPSGPPNVIVRNSAAEPYCNSNRPFIIGANNDFGNVTDQIQAGSSFLSPWNNIGQQYVCIG